MVTESATFDPGKHLTKLPRRQKDGNGQWKQTTLDYLEVKWRLVWLRSEQPDARISTEIVQVDSQHCIVRAHVALPSGGEATGLACESPDTWKDYVEKAETSAIGRALAALGYGTQFCEDFAFGQGDGAAVVDSPVAQRDRSAPATNGQRPPMTEAQAVAPKGPADSWPDRPATEPQIKAIYAVARGAQAMDDGQIEELCRQRYGCLPAELNREDASKLIDALKLPGKVAPAEGETRTAAVSPEEQEFWAVAKAREFATRKAVKNAFRLWFPSDGLDVLVDRHGWAGCTQMLMERSEGDVLDPDPLPESGDQPLSQSGLDLNVPTQGGASSKGAHQ